MANQNKQNLISSRRELQKLALNESATSMDRLDELLAGCFALQKLYGREVANTGTVIGLFQSMLAKYPAEKVIRAFEIWLEKSQEFPTPADIIGLIKRNGNPPLSKEMFIAISKKDGEDRTPDDWQYLRDYDAEQRGEAWDDADEQKQQNLQAENTLLRQQIKKMEDDYRVLADTLSEVKMAKGIEKPPLSILEKAQRTIDAMKAAGAKDEDIKTFADEYGADLPARTG